MASTVTLTGHAVERLEQRGIRPEWVPAVLRHGLPLPTHREWQEKRWVPRWLARRLGRPYLADLAVVVDVAEARVITVMRVGGAA